MCIRDRLTPMKLKGVKSASAPSVKSYSDIDVVQLISIFPLVVDKFIIIFSESIVPPFGFVPKVPSW